LMIITHAVGVDVVSFRLHVWCMSNICAY
jgi:hypothetical protein